MKDQKAIQATQGTQVKAMGNGRVKFNRVIKNIFLALFGKEKSMAGVSELQAEGCFANIQKEKNKLAAIVTAQENAIVEREEKAKADTKKADKEIAEIRKEILDKEEKLQDKLASLKDESAEITKEKERCDRVCKRMDEFFA